MKHHVNTRLPDTVLKFISHFRANPYGVSSTTLLSFAIKPNVLAMFNLHVCVFSVFCKSDFPKSLDNTLTLSHMKYFLIRLFFLCIIFITVISELLL